MTMYMMRLVTNDGKFYESDAAELSDEGVVEMSRQLRDLIDSAKKTVEFTGLYHNGDPVTVLIIDVDKIARIEIL